MPTKKIHILVSMRVFLKKLCDRQCDHFHEGKIVPVMALDFIHGASGRQDWSVDGCPAHLPMIKNFIEYVI